ncbi:DUF6911 family protein [Acetobacter sp.]|jgi:hypothetical protein|uniref:DUF6911 family protein n=1 Tax=Acetobacter sp. TaxID=440 RepID=UPI0025BB9CAA|nr:hypothetical protein [Acetobacter sp.]MCH4091114.1 hypothetical protein [Acetobacter sp.]MCI1300297.1 hypothetical protein [Acetobacter sp.]MCI1316035.1 hypothetical protein [Acetobacter sp.]
MKISLWRGWDEENPNNFLQIPSWDTVVQAIYYATEHDNSLRLYSETQWGEDFLSLSAQNGNIFLELYRNISDSDEQTLTLSNPNWMKEGLKGVILHDWGGNLGQVPCVEINGNFWSAEMVTRNLSLTIELFKEFYNTGNISHPWMK